VAVARSRRGVAWREIGGACPRAGRAVGQENSAAIGANALDERAAD
jgi:hypothetical protein